MKRIFYIVTSARTITGIGALILRELYHISYAVKCGYIPLVDLKHYKNQYFKDKRTYKDNVWEYFFKQPFDLGLDDIKDEDEVIVAENILCPMVKFFEPHPLFYPKNLVQDFKTKKIKNELSKYLKFNDETKLYLEKKVNEALNGESNVLGVLLRGTDYTKRQTYDEFIQPNTKTVINEAKKLLNEGKFKKIYLATEDKFIYEEFKKEFGGLLIENRQYMYSTNYDSEKYLSEIKVNRKNHNYNLALEYLASLYILSKCKGFLGGMAGGTRIAYLLSENWQYLKIYDLGQYGRYNSCLEKIFSIKNVVTNKNEHKVFTVLGLKFKVNKDKKSKFYLNLKNFLTSIQYNLNYKKENIKGVVYSATTGGYDDVPRVLYADNKMDYILFTDNKKLIKKKKIGVWKIKKIRYSKLDNTKNARWHKTHPHILFPEYNESIWIDSNIEVLSDKLFKTIEQKKASLLVPLHNLRECIYEECLAVEILKKEEVQNIEKMKNFLIEKGMPKHYGLNETGIIYRKHNSKEIIKLMEEWWYFIENYTKRDQLSFSYVLFTNGIKVKDISINNIREDRENFILKRHKRQGLWKTF